MELKSILTKAWPFEDKMVLRSKGMNFQGFTDLRTTLDHQSLACADHRLLWRSGLALKTPCNDLIWPLMADFVGVSHCFNGLECGQWDLNGKIGGGPPSPWCYNGEEQVAQLLRRCCHLPQNKNTKLQGGRSLVIRSGPLEI